MSSNRVRLSISFSLGFEEDRWLVSFLRYASQHCGVTLSDILRCIMLVAVDAFSTAEPAGFTREEKRLVEDLCACGRKLLLRSVPAITMLADDMYVSITLPLRKKDARDRMILEFIERERKKRTSISAVIKGTVMWFVNSYCADRCGEQGGWKETLPACKG